MAELEEERMRKFANVDYNTYQYVCLNLLWLIVVNLIIILIFLVNTNKIMNKTIFDFLLINIKYIRRNHLLLFH